MEGGTLLLLLLRQGVESDEEIPIVQGHPLTGNHVVVVNWLQEDLILFR